jgi:HSP20 family molecular chaperone IbpA
MAEKSLKKMENQMQNSRDAVRTGERFMAPPVDVYETDEGLILLADVPGLDEKSLHVSVDKGVLTIEGRASVASGERFYHEFSMAGYWRQFQVPDSFDAAQAKAHLKDGVLTLHLPKTEAARPKRINVSVH